MVHLPALASLLPDWPLSSLPGSVLGSLATAGASAVEAVPSLRAGLSDGILTPMVIWIFAVLAGLATVLVLPGRFSVTWRRVGGGILFAAFLLLTIALLVSNGYVNVYFWAFAIISILGSVRVITHPQPVYSALYFVLTVFSSAGLFVLCYAEFMAVALVTIYAGAILVTYTFVIMLAADAAPEETGPGGGEAAAKRFVAAHDANARSPFMACVTGFVTMGVLLFVVFDRAPAEETLEKRLSLTEAKFFNRVDDDGYAGAMGEDVETVAAESALLVATAEPRGDLYSYDNKLAHAQESDRGGIQVLGIYLFTRQMVSLQVAGLILTVAMIGAIVIARKQVLPTARDRQLAAASNETLNSPFTPASDNPKSLPVHGTGDPRQKAYPQN